MNRARSLLNIRTDIRTVCKVHKLSDAELLEMLQTVHANTEDTGFAVNLLDLICDIEGEVNYEAPEIDAFKTLEPARLDKQIERV